MFDQKFQSLPGLFLVAQQKKLVFLLQLPENIHHLQRCPK